MFYFELFFVRAQTYEMTKINTDNDLPQNRIKDIVKDKYGFFWLATEAGIVRFDGQNILSYDIPLSNKRFEDFFGNAKTDQVFSTNEGEKNTIIINRKNLKITDNNFSFNIVRNQSNYSKNSFDNGVNPEANHFIKIYDATYYIYKDHKLWILTYGNVFFLLENNKLLKLPLDHNNFLAQAHTIIENNYGFFGVSTNNGIFKMKETELLKFRNTPSYIPPYYFFDKSCGFVTNEFNGGGNPYEILLSDSTIAFPSLEGIVIFKPQRILTHYPAPDYTIETAIINNTQHKYFSKEIILERNFNTATILFDLPYYGNISNLLIQAKFNKDGSIWENIRGNKEFTFTNLPYGNYELLFRVLVSQEGKYSYKKILITVKPYFYEMWEFQILISIFIICISILISVLRLLYLQKKNFQLEDITTPIKYLVITTEMLYEIQDDDIKLRKEYLFSLHKYTVQLYKFTQTLKEYPEVYKNEKIYEIKNTQLTIL